MMKMSMKWHTDHTDNKSDTQTRNPALFLNAAPDGFILPGEVQPAAIFDIPSQDSRPQPSGRSPKSSPRLRV